VTETGPNTSGSLSGDLAVFGPFFAIAIHAHHQPLPSPWQPMSALIADTDVLAARVDRVRTVLADRAGRPPGLIDVRVAASVAHLGLVARLMAPRIGALALGQPPLSWSIEDLWWQDDLGGPYPLSIAIEAGHRSPGPGWAVEAITDAISDRYRVSRKVLWGNVGSTTNTAAELIRAARPDLTAQAHHEAATVLSDPRIDGGTTRAGPQFRRRSCCLIYRIANNRAAACGDCVLI